MNLDIAKDLILKSALVSFDIFDTLLVRPYIKASHLFLHMEQSLNIEGFAKARGLASKMTRKSSSKEDITLDEIYENMPESFKPYKEQELLFESKCLKQNPQIYELYKFACQNNKKIAFISDMYLPKEFLIKVLAENGYSHFDYFYLSGEEGVAKYSGNLFKKFLEDTKINPQEILHIGDHSLSDNKIPKKFGMNSFLISGMMDKFFEKNKNLKKLFKKYKNSLTISIILALLAQKFALNTDNENNYFYNFGYRYGGAIGYGFSNFILETAKTKNIDELIFIARDGYLLEQLVNKLSSENLHTSYVYAQRVLKEKFNIDYNKNPDAENAILDYRNYLHSLGIDFNKEIMVADTGASSFSAQRILEKAIGKKLLGIYTIINKEETLKKYDIQCIRWANNKNDILNITSLIELLFMAPEPPVCDIQNGKPVYITPLKEEVQRNQLCPIISKGILDFVDDMQKHFKDLPVSFTTTEVNDFIKTFCLNLTPLDKKMLGNVYYATSSNHMEYKYSVLRLIYKMSKHPKYYLDRILFKLKSKNR